MTYISDIIKHLEEWCPLALQEDYDNCGLILGDKSKLLSGAIICLDVTEEVLNEAILANCNLIVAHHPIIFKPLKKIIGKSYVDRIVIKAIQNNIAIYAIHTNLDNLKEGVNFKIAQKLNLRNPRIFTSEESIFR